MSAAADDRGLCGGGRSAGGAKSGVSVDTAPRHGIGPLYLLHFAQTHVDFRLAEFCAAAEYLCVPYALVPTPARGAVTAPVPDRTADVSRPFMLCQLPSDDAAQELLRRCSCLRAVWELWVCADTYADLHARNRLTRMYERWIPAQYAWKALMQGFNSAISDRRRVDLIESFSYMAFEGPTRMKGADLTWGVLEEYSRALGVPDMRGIEELGDSDPRLVQLFLGRKIKDRSGCTPARDLIDGLSLKKRQYIGNTSMESEMSIVMANMALSGPSKLVYDPFAGTGSVLYACSTLGAMTLGSDIDGRMLRGRDARDGRSGVALSAAQYGLSGRILDTVVCDMTQAPWREPFRGCARGGGLVDAIVTDPPYGVRAGAKRLGKRNAAQQRDEPFIMPDGTPSHVLPDYVPPTKPYHLSELVHDLLEYASALLRPHGRLVFWMPTMSEDNAATTVPEHPDFGLVAHSLQDFGKWGRRLITMEKRTDAHGAPRRGLSPPAPSSPPPMRRVRATDQPSEFRNRAGVSYFERERERLVSEIAASVETLIGTNNAVNRKLEEHIAVGKGFESISELWGRFSELMADAGVPPLSAPASASVAEDGKAQGRATETSAPPRETSAPPSARAPPETPHGNTHTDDGFPDADA
ncbi:tRNA (guanine(10)-N(2))-methyltransferase [Malassezia sp. CBS 17886]|nr:tRNA (guanine(10)-N(2))-methyltransferase [Malassezia sp. CBS 17886]